MTREQASDPLGRLAAGIAVVGAVLVLYFALFPFDFVDQGRSLSEVVRRFAVVTDDPWAPRAVPANILLTIPLGFGVGGIVRRRTSSTWRSVLAASMCAFGLSCGVEAMQSAWLLRDPSVDDIVANAAGGAVGAWLWTRSEPALCAARGSIRAAPRVARRVAGVVLCLLPAVVLSVTTIAHRADSELAHWDRRFPFAVGNEPTGDRPWRGSLSRLSLADRAFAPDEVAGLLDGRRMKRLAPRSTLVDHNVREDRAVPAGWSLRRTDDPSVPPFSPNGLELGPQWMQTDESVAGISQRIDAADSFTLLLDVTAASPRQFGPARLASISSGPHHTNLTVGQEGVDLVVRVRTPFTGDNGTSPEYVVPGVFADDGSRRLVITYRRPALSVTVDPPGETSRLALLPETVPLVATFTDDLGVLRFSDLGNVLRQLLFATIMFAPWTAWVILVAFPRRHRRGEALTLAIVPIVSIEAVVAWCVPGHPFGAGFALATVAVVVVVVIATQRTSVRT
jgi:VanZ like protein